VAPELVRANQRARLCGAMVHLVAERGYERAAVSELCALAGVSSGTFYSRFPGGKLECFLAAHELVVTGLITWIEDAWDEETDPRQRLRLAFAAYARALSQQPRAAQLALVEAYAVGTPGLRCMRGTAERFATMLAEPTGAGDDPDTARRLSLARAIVAGAEHAGRVFLAAQRPLRSAALTDALLGWTLFLRDPPPHALAYAARPVSAPVPARVRAHAATPGSRDCERERARLLDAATRLALRNASSQLSAGALMREAHVSHRRLHALFATPAHCLLIAIVCRARVALARVRTAARGIGERPYAVRRALATLLDTLARDPDLAQLLFVALPALGREGVTAQSRLIGELGELLWAGPPRRRRGFTAQTSAGAVWGTIAQEVIAGSGAELRLLQQPLSLVTLAWDSHVHHAR
jgi:AcrR family transcriptional regulator